jgi:hypothetical protein
MLGRCFVFDGFFEVFSVFLLRRRNGCPYSSSSSGLGRWLCLGFCVWFGLHAGCTDSTINTAKKAMSIYRFLKKRSVTWLKNQFKKLLWAPLTPSSS